MQMAMVMPDVIAAHKKRWALVYPNFEYGQAASAKSNTCSGQITAIVQSLPNSSRATLESFRRRKVDDLLQSGSKQIVLAVVAWLADCGCPPDSGKKAGCGLLFSCVSGFRIWAVRDFFDGEICRGKAFVVKYGGSNNRKTGR